MLLHLMRRFAQQVVRSFVLGIADQAADTHHVLKYFAIALKHLAVASGHNRLYFRGQPFKLMNEIILRIKQK